MDKQFDSVPLATVQQRKGAKKPLIIGALVVAVVILLLRLIAHFHQDTATSDATFEHDVLKNQGTVLVLFYLPYPDPDSIKMRNTIKNFHAQIKAERFVCDISKNFATASKYKATAAPTLAVFDGGILLGNVVGNKSKEEITTALNKLLLEQHKFPLQSPAQPPSPSPVQLIQSK